MSVGTTSVGMILSVMRMPRRASTSTISTGGSTFEKPRARIG